MLTGLDHVIIGVNDLERATRVFEEKLGLRASGGGRHPMGGTANRIIVIGDTYLELITMAEPAEAQRSMLERLAKGEGYLNCVFGSDALRADSEAMAKRGIAIIGPQEGRLTAADGRSRGWIRTDVERPDLAQHYPFLIQHDSSGEERRRRLAGWQRPPEHPLGVQKVLSTTLAVEDLAEATERFRRIYGLEPRAAFSGEEEGWEATVVSFALGKQSFELAAPGSAERGDGELPEKGALRRYLDEEGEWLCRMTLGVADLEAARQYLEKQRVAYRYQQGPSELIWIQPAEACGAAIVLREV